MTELLQFTLFGLMLGCVYAIAATGLVLTYTVTGVFNFAHGAVGMLAAFVYYQLRVEGGVPTPVAIALVVLVVAPLLGIVVERLMRRFEGSDYATSLVVTIALTVGLLGLVNNRFPGASRHMPPLLGDGRLVIAEVPISYDRIAQVLVAAAVVVGLRFLLFGTPLGARMRAVVDDRELAGLSGVRSHTMARFSWMIGFALAALGGVLFAASGQNLNSFVLTLLVLNAYGAAMIGRLTSLPMTLVGALILGVLQELTNVTWLWPSSPTWSGIRLAIPGIFLVVAVLFVPSFRLSAGRVVGRDQPRVPTLPTSAVAAVGLVVCVALFVRVFPGTDVYVIQGLVYAAIALSLVAVTGLSGQVSLTQYLFVGVGAFVTGETFGGDSVFGMILGGLLAAALGVLVALPSVRLRGLHLALSTFGIALVGREAILGDVRMFGLGGIEVGRPEVLGMSTSSDSAFAVWCAVVFGVLAVGLVAIRRSWFGRQLTALRDSELAAATLGMPVRTTKVVIFAVSAFFAGCSGALFGGLQGSVQGLHFEPVASLVIVLFAFVGGITTVTGALLAGASFALLAYTQEAQPDLGGLVFIVVAAVAIGLGRQPNGLAGMLFDRMGPLRDRLEPALAGLRDRGARTPQAVEA